MNMATENEALPGHKERLNTMERRNFLKTAGAAAGLATLLGPEAFQGVKAAVSSMSDLTPQQAAREEALWGEVKNAFTVHRGLIHMDNGYTCPTPRVVTEAVVRYIWDQEQGPYGLFVREARDRKKTVKQALARLFGSSPEEIALVRNATEALKTVLYGIPLKAGDEVLTTMQDYGSMVGVLKSREKEEGINLVQVWVPTPPKSMDDLVEIYERAITPKTKVILVSHVTYTTGQVFPVKRICDMAHQRGIEVVVDGAHAVGQLDFKVSDLGCDYYGSSLHKWLYAPKGTGLLYIRQEHIEKIKPLYGASTSRRFNANASMRKYESVGTLSEAPFLAIGEAVAFHNAIGPKRKEERLRYIKNYWAERLGRHPAIHVYTPTASEMSCGIASVGIEGVDPSAMQEYLWEEHQMLTSRGYYEGADRKMQWVRVSPNLYTPFSDMDYFCDVMEEVANKGLPEPYRSYEPDPRRFR
jgi:isopenicillin-N epimerase